MARRMVRPGGWCAVATFLGVLVGGLAAPLHAWSISGTVKSSAGSTLPGVAVTVQDSSKYSTTTDASGGFTLSSPSGVLSRTSGPNAFYAQLNGRELVVQCPMDGALELSLVDASGRSIWSANAVSQGGIATAELTNSVRSGAIFLRIRHAGGVEFQAVSRGEQGLQIKASPTASRAMAANPTLIFKLSGYDSATYSMATSTATGITVTMTPTAPGTTCAFPTTFKWKDNGSAIASPSGNGWVAIKDFTNVTYNGKHYIYSSTHDNSNYGSEGMAPFTNWSDAASAKQTKMNTSMVAPELMYFTPKKEWILSYQWCPSGTGKFCYVTGSDPSNANGWGSTKALLSEDVATAQGAAYGPIDHVPICDATTCYLFYAGDNGHIYRASMPIGNFPGVFTGSQSILSASTNDLFEAVEVYTVKGTGKYLMIVECMGSARYFRAFSATSLGGTFSPISNATGENTPFAGRKNISNPPSWTNDVSHGDMVRNEDETRTIDPCNLQLLYQGYAASFSGAYDLKPYKLGLLTFEGK